MMRRLVCAFTLSLGIAACDARLALAQGKGDTPRNTAGGPMLQVDPRLIVEAAEAWRLIASARNPIWPGWNATDTPLLFYLPGRQDVLINHPRPPEGFVAYRGPLTFPNGRITVRDGRTTLEWDGQNTARVIEGVQTLVVADPLSNLRQRVRAMLEGARPGDLAHELDFSALATDPYAQLTTIVHEAFHVFQARVAPTKSANEMLLSSYPVLSAPNNVGFALEGEALADALTADDDSTTRQAALRWLAVRLERRAALPAQAITYENGAEFGEGLAKYTEYRLLATLEGRTPSAQMWWIQGFHGYENLKPRRLELIDMMRRHMRGEVSINNDPYGTAPLRMRLYYSGMAIGALLDQLAPDWKTRIIEPDVSLTDLVQQALRPRPDDLRIAAQQARSSANYAELIAQKERLAQEGHTRIDSLLADIERGSGTAVIIEYGALDPPRAGLAFTPFGIIAVDADRTIYTQVPIAARFPDGSAVAQTEPRPLLHDRARRLIRFRLRHAIPPDSMARVAGQPASGGARVGPHKFELPGFSVDVRNATIQLEGSDLRIVLERRQ